MVLLVAYVPYVYFPSILKLYSLVMCAKHLLNYEHIKLNFKEKGQT